jgi:hypothetical protein
LGGIAGRTGDDAGIPAGSSSRRGFEPFGQWREGPQQRQSCPPPSCALSRRGFKSGRCWNVAELHRPAPLDASIRYPGDSTITQDVSITAPSHGAPVGCTEEQAFKMRLLEERPQCSCTIKRGLQAAAGAFGSRSRASILGKWRERYPPLPMLTIDDARKLTAGPFACTILAQGGARRRLGRASRSSRDTSDCGSSARPTWRARSRRRPACGACWGAASRSRAQELTIGDAGRLPHDQHDTLTACRLASCDEAIVPITCLPLIRPIAAEGALEAR